MADTFKNPYNYTSPIGAALADLTRTIVSGPSRAEKIKAAEDMLKVKRYNESLLATQEGLRGFGGPTFNLPDVAASAIGAGVSGADLANFNQLLTADGASSLTDPAIDIAQRGAGGAYSSTFAGFSADQGNQNMRAANTLAETRRNNIATLGEDRRQFDQKPFVAVGDNGPEVFTNLTAIGQQANVTEADQKGYLLGENFANLGQPGALTPEQETVLGARGTGAETPRNYVLGDQRFITYDGVTDAQTGQKLPPGGVIVAGEGAAAGRDITTATQTDTEKQRIALDMSDAELDATQQLISTMPDTAFGATGIVMQTAQGATVLANNLAKGLGFTSASEVLQEFQKEAAAGGVDPNIISGAYDARFPERSTLYISLMYAAARANSPTGVLSDLDVQFGREMAGNPEDLFTSKEGLITKLNTIRAMNQRKRKVLEGVTGQAPAASAAAPVDNIPTVATPEEAAALPPGTQFRTPDGRLKVRP